MPTDLETARARFAARQGARVRAIPGIAKGGCR
jgi:hypothetical protein